MFGTAMLQIHNVKMRHSDIRQHFILMTIAAVFNRGGEIKSQRGVFLRFPHL